MVFDDISGVDDKPTVDKYKVGIYRLLVQVPPVAVVRTLESAMIFPRQFLVALLRPGAVTVLLLWRARSTFMAVGGAVVCCVHHAIVLQSSIIIDAFRGGAALLEYDRNYDKTRTAMRTVNTSKI